jgi:hypothetical protein
MNGGVDEPTPSARARSRDLEDVMRLIADIERHRADPFALPTGLFLRVMSKDGGGPQVPRMTRVSDWGVDLTRGPRSSFNCRG